ncbi:MAG TPA: polyprenyl diphosphate synthase [Rhabdochlamydiaceae bacterium]|jgi:undecaprenyl diphosphate synthase
MNSLCHQPLQIYAPEDLASLIPGKTPYHVAIIMDGNRRWARSRGLQPILGHWQGAETLTHVVRAASELGIKVLTVYAFSKENWQRSKEEVDALMHIYKTYLESQRGPMLQEGVRLRTIGDLSALPESVAEALRVSKSVTANGKTIDLVMAFNYGGRDDIRRAFIHMMEDCEKGKLSKYQVTEELIGTYLDTADYPDPDIVIRTSGEKRQSNFLLWQVSYSEFYHTEVLWPDFDERELLKAVCEFQKRERRFGE